MQITLFAKRRTSKDGKPFFQYLATLTRKTGETETMRVCFRNCEAPKADTCPRNIVFQRENANVATRNITVPSTGNIKPVKTLWLTAWVDGEVYVDHTLDDYAD